MFHSQLSRKLYLAVAAAGFIAVAGCSSQPDTAATNQAPKQAAKASPVKKAVPATNTTKADAPKVVPVSAKVTKPTGPVITVPKGTSITAVVGQTLASDKNHQGDTFVASLSAPVKVDGKTVLPKGAHITGKVVTVKKHELKVELASVVLRGKSYDLQTNSLRPSDKVQAKSKAASADKSSDKTAQKAKQKDNSKLSTNSQLTFKLSKPVIIPAKG